MAFDQKSKSQTHMDTVDANNNTTSINTFIENNKSDCSVDTKFTTFVYFFLKVVVLKKCKRMIHKKAFSL